MAPDTGKRISFQSDSRDSDSRISAEVCLLADEDIKWQRSRSAPYQRSKWTFKQAARAHIVFLLLFVATYASLFYFYGYEYAYGGPVLPSPARSAVQYIRKLIDANLYLESPFLGEPRPEMDAAWDDLMEYQYIAVMPSQLGDDTSVSLNDVTGRVLITLEAYSTLDCLNYVRKYTHRSYYNITKDDAGTLLFGKCIDKVREAVMCYADISFNTFTWVPQSLTPFPNFRVDHECKDWDRIVQWAKENQPPNLGSELLMHPKLGKSGPGHFVPMF